MFKSEDMCSRKVGYVDVIADRGPVLSRIIHSKDVNNGPKTEDALNHQRDQMRFRVVLFTDLSGRVGT
jgi:hypothetical protein